MPGNRHSDLFLKQIAEEYLHYARSVGGRYKPNRHIAESHGVPLSRVESWIKAARHRGILQPHVKLQCTYCRQTMVGLPPVIGHHHSASMDRMGSNAFDLAERCGKLAGRAHDDGDKRRAVAYRAAARHYAAITKLFEDFE